MLVKGESKGGYKKEEENNADGDSERAIDFIMWT